MTLNGCNGTPYSI